MDSSIRVYLDEAGDDGFRFNSYTRRSSRWFVLGGLIVGPGEQARPADVIRQTRDRSRLKASVLLHYRKLRPDQREALATALNESGLRTCAVAVYKPDLTGPYERGRRAALYQAVSQEFFRSLKHWLGPSRQLRQVHLVFAASGRIDYEQVFRAGLPPAPAVDGIVIASITSAKITGPPPLQLADCVASRLFHGLEQEESPGVATPKLAPCLA
jgi:Protein of unknown function (DUF3800)